MDFTSTPCERAHCKLLVNPPIPSKTEKKTALIAKNIFGAIAIPFLFLYSISLVTSMAGMEIFGWLAGFGVLGYIIVDLFSENRELKSWSSKVDIPIVCLLAIAVISLKVNAPEADFWKAIGELRWMILLYLFYYGFQFFPGINKYYIVLCSLGFVISLYAIYQHFSGDDFRYLLNLRNESAVTPAPSKTEGLYQSVGLFSHHLTYGYSFSMIFCLTLSGALIFAKKRKGLFLFFALATLSIGLSLIWTYGRGVWISIVVSTLFILMYFNRKLLITGFIFIAIAIGSSYKAMPDIRSRINTFWSEGYHSNKDRRDLWKAHWAMFSDHPVIGVGYNQNEGLVPKYYEKLGIKNSFGGHAHNSYFQFLSSTGFLGLTFYLLFIFFFLLMTHSLYISIPKVHYWHRAIVLGALGAQVSMHIGGMTQWNFGDSEVNHLFVFLLSLISYLNLRYERGIVPDDYAL